MQTLCYNIILTTAAILAMPALIPLALKTEKRRQTFPGRIGLTCDIPLPKTGENRIWVHALSLGEVLSAVPLAKALRSRYPDETIVFTTSTLTGLEIAKKRVGNFMDHVSLFPYDFILSVRLIANRIRPKIAIMVETDLWPNFFREMDRRNVPVVIVNGRLSDKSFAGYQRFPFLFHPLFSQFARVCAQSAEDARRFRKLGAAADRVLVVGNLKYDKPRPDASPAALAELRTCLGISDKGPVLVAGSTHLGEEGILSDAVLTLRRDFPNLFCITAPRDPNRAGEVARIFQDKGMDVRRLSEKSRGKDGVVIDTIGLLAGLYGLADVAFVGGSLIPFGGHNPLEPAAMSRPVMFGPQMQSFQEISQALLTAGGAVRVTDAQTLARTAGRLLADPSEAHLMGQRGQAVINAHQGALNLTLDEVDAVVKMENVKGKRQNGNGRSSNS